MAGPSRRPALVARPIQEVDVTLRLKEIEHKFIVSDQFDLPGFRQAVAALGPTRTSTVSVQDRYFLTESGSARRYLIRHRFDAELHHLTLKALEMAVKRRCPEIGLLHHSDQGSTYASEDYQQALAARGIVCSMSRRGNCHDNAVMESFFSTVKFELADQFASHGDAKMELFDYIEVFYNQRRRHSTIGRISPAAFERAQMAEVA